ncbi:MAG: NTP transferase domain-containing protein, partial [Phycisphaerales bacterium]
MHSSDSAKLTLVILAAGEGHRYGGLKQLDPVGPSAATLIDYTAFDARRAGFGRIIFVIRPETESEFRAHFEPRLRPHLEVAFCFQRLVASPKESAGRTRPWGTGHAVLAVAGEIEGPFAAANADDFYGADSLHAVRKFLSSSDASDIPTYAVVGYVLSETLSETGGVSRALCNCGLNDDLLDIVEADGIERHGCNGRYTDAEGTSHIVDGSTLVSMNLWAFQPTIFEQLRVRLERRLRLSGEKDDSEFRLPSAVCDLLRTG